MRRSTHLCGAMGSMPCCRATGAASGKWSRAARQRRAASNRAGRLEGVLGGGDDGAYQNGLVGDLDARDRSGRHHLVEVATELAQR